MNYFSYLLIRYIGSTLKVRTEMYWYKNNKNVYYGKFTRFNDSVESKYTDT